MEVIRPAKASFGWEPFFVNILQPHSETKVQIASELRYSHSDLFAITFEQNNILFLRMTFVALTDLNVWLVQPEWLDRVPTAER